MTELELLREWFRYNDVARLRYLAALAELPPDELLRDRGASFPLLDIFLHVLDAQRVWISWAAADRMKEWEGARARLRLRERVKTLPEAADAMKAVGAEVWAYLDQLTEADLPHFLEYDEQRPDGRWFRARTRVRDLLWHLVEEELQHRGEMNALFWQLGREPPVLDWVDWKAAAAP
jgi:uncharacterized damage-inducible protein DinB